MFYKNKLVVYVFANTRYRVVEGNGGGFNLVELSSGYLLYKHEYNSLKELADHAYKSSYRLVHARLILS